MKEIALYENWINEIGDSSAKPFKWISLDNMKSWIGDCIDGAKDKKTSGTQEDIYYKSKPFRYEFKSDSTGTNYSVHIGGFVGRNIWIAFQGEKPKDWVGYHAIVGLGFSIEGDFEKTTNLNEQFRVMATVTECGVDFLQRFLDDGRININQFHMKPKADREGQRGIDSRRAKLYAPYIKAAFRKLKTKKDYFVDQEPDGFVLRFGKASMDSSFSTSILASTFENVEKKMKEIALYEEWVNEDDISKVFKQKSTGDTYLDMRDFWRAELGEDDEDNVESKKRMFDRAKTYSISVNKIVPNQDYLNSETILDYIEKGSSELPSGVKFKNGLVVVFDGHHRIAAQISKGQSSIQMKILKANF
jgi:hypothetical protein